MQLQKKKRTKTKTARAVGALVLTAAWMVGVTEMFKLIYNKDREEDENVLQAIGIDFVGNLLGGFPIFSDIYTVVSSGQALNAIGPIFVTPEGIVRLLTGDVQK